MLPYAKLVPLVTSTKMKVNNYDAFYLGMTEYNILLYLKQTSNPLIGQFLFSNVAI